MMVPQLRLAPHQSEDLQAICILDPNEIQSALQGLGKLEPVPLHSRQIFSAVKSAIPKHPEAADALTRQALSLRGMMRQWGLATSDLLSGISAAIEQHEDWQSDDVEKWKAIEGGFRQLIESQPIRLTANAIDLSYEYANLYRRGRVITDVRPLFSDNADVIEGAVVSYTLRLRFDNIEGEHDFSIAMDQQDIEQLVEQCQRAMTKARTAKELMTRSVSVPTIITGER
jgi:hypothetical protein